MGILIAERKKISQIIFLLIYFFCFVYVMSTSAQAKKPEIGCVTAAVVARSVAGIYACVYFLHSVVVKIVRSRKRFARFCGVVIPIVVIGNISKSNMPMFAYFFDMLKPCRMLMYAEIGRRNVLSMGTSH